MNKQRQSTVVTILDKKPFNLEIEKQKAFKEKENILKKFEEKYIFDEFLKLRRGMKLKNYVDGSRYEGEIIGEKRTGKGVYHYANGDIFAGD